MTLRTPLTDAEDTALRDAIGKVAHGAIVTRYVIVAETIDADTGEPVIEDITPNTQPIWDSVGILDFVLTTWRASIARNVIDGDEAPQ